MVYLWQQIDRLLLTPRSSRSRASPQILTRFLGLPPDALLLQLRPLGLLPGALLLPLQLVGLSPSGLLLMIGLLEILYC